MKNSRSISIETTTPEGTPLTKEFALRGLYWGELDDSSKAALKDAVSLLDDINLDTLDQLMARQEKAPTEKAAKGQKYKGLHKATLLACGVVNVGGVTDDEEVVEHIRTLDGKQADEVAQAIADLTTLPDDEGNLGNK